LLLFMMPASFNRMGKMEISINKTRHYICLQMANIRQIDAYENSLAKSNAAVECFKRPESRLI
jgi:hypothetical protein